MGFTLLVLAPSLNAQVERVIPGDTTAVDPVCGTVVEKARAAGITEVEGVRYYFCSKTDQLKFAENPLKYIKQLITHRPMIKGGPGRVKDCGGGDFKPQKTPSAHPLTLDKKTGGQMKIKIKSIELQYFSDCPNWKRALSGLKKVLKGLGIGTPIQVTLIKDEAEAVARIFLGSPTIKIDGQDIERVGGEPFFSCRIYRFEGKNYGYLPPKMIREFLLHLNNRKIQKA